MAKKRKITLPKIEDINISPDTSCIHPILEDNTLLCIHGGKVNLKAKNAKRIKSDNIPIMLHNEIQGASISGCVNPPIAGGPCTKVALVFAYTYSNHKVNHKHSVLQMGLIGVSNKGYPILAIPKQNKIKFALTKIKANPLAKIKWDKIKWEGIGGKNNQSVIQTHHIATDKNKRFTKEFQKITKKYGLKLDGDWNKVKMPHRGRHPNEYHEYILEKMSKIDKIARGDKNKFLKEFEKLKEEIKNNPALLHKEYYKERK
ncbi:AHH domain-containing protein [Campylobacter lari]|uniref:AHH domain-containing protein n=1 Tax=Campylobacter lari TaxID=201 RepID=UPI0039908B0D